MAYQTMEIYDREFVAKGQSPRWSGFTPRNEAPAELRPNPYSDSELHMNHILRKSTIGTMRGKKSITYHLWSEAAKQEPYGDPKNSVKVSSTYWRNLRQQHGVLQLSDGGKVSAIIASLYPLDVPCPSTLGSNTYTKYVSEARRVSDEVMRKSRAFKVEQDMALERQKWRETEAKKHKRHDLPRRSGIVSGSSQPNGVQTTPPATRNEVTRHYITLAL